MLSLAKSLLLIARYFRRIAVSLEKIQALYELDLMERGIRQYDSTITDEVEVSYGSKLPDEL